jgi:hypothetical protein
MKKLNFNNDLKGIAVSSNHLSISFWLRLNTNVKRDFSVFEIRCRRVESLLQKVKNFLKHPLEFLLNYALQNTFKLVFKISDEPSTFKCIFEIIPPNSKEKIVIIGPDCKLKDNQEWRFFSITIVKDNDIRGKAFLKVFNSQGTASVYSELIPSNYNYDLVSKESNIYFNPNKSVSPVYEITDFVIAEYIPTDNELYSTFKLRPPLCDSECKDCTNKCIT